jgi:hypothetical protein
MKNHQTPNSKILHQFNPCKSKSTKRKIIKKLNFTFLLAINSTAAISQTQLICEIKYEHGSPILSEKKEFKSTARLKIEQKDGYYWRKDGNGNTQIVNINYPTFTIIDPEIESKFRAIPENGESHLTDNSEDAFYKYQKNTIYKTGFEKIEKFFLDQITGRLEISENYYLKNEKPTQYKIIKGICKKSDSKKKF